MLDQNLQAQVRDIFAALEGNFRFRLTVAPDHPSRGELLELFDELCLCSPRLTYDVTAGEGLSFTVSRNGEEAAVCYRAVPTGHEFSTLLLTVLNLDGKGRNLPDEATARRIRAIDRDVVLQSFISLTCTNCPDVVQALNVFSFLNPRIRHEIIDGALHPSEADARGVQAVPTVFLDGSVFHVGRGSLGELLSKLEAQTGAAVAFEKEVRDYDVVVIGGGPAGITSAVYSARKGLRVAVVAERIGGQVLDTTGIENLSSVPHTTGAQLAADLRRHAEAYAIDLLDNREVLSVAVTDGVKQIETVGETLRTPALIVATGAGWRRLGIPGEAEHIGAGVAFCTHCDGPFYKGKRVVVVGGGNSGLEAAIDLSALATHVTVLEYADTLRGDEVLQQKLAQTPNVDIRTGVATREIIDTDGKVSALVYTDRTDGSEHTVATDGVFVQIGLQPRSELVAGLVACTERGEIIVDAHCRTDVAGIYAAGDVTTVPFKQIVVAMGEGAKAALSAFEDRITDRLR